MTKNRAIETRDNEMREEYKMFYSNPHQVPKEVLKEGMDYHRARRSIRGEADHGNIEALRMQGWVLVPRIKKDKNNLNPLGSDSMAEDFYCTTDTVLMERPEEIGIYRKQQENIVNAKAVKLPGVFKANPDSNAVIPVINSF